MDDLADRVSDYHAVDHQNHLGMNMRPKQTDVGGDVFSVVDEGKGPVLLLVHGFPLDHSMWSAQIAHFSSTHRVIAPDLRGFGQSVVTPGTVTMKTMADDLARILAKLGVLEPVVFCGLSMGGYVAWQFWKLHADKLRGMILCDTKAATDSVEVARARELMADSVERSGDTREIADNLGSRLFSPETVRHVPAIVEVTKKVIERTAPHAIAAAQRGMALREDARPWLTRINLPCLLLGGADDVITPPDEMAGMAQALSNPRFVKIERAGHMAPLEQPSATNRVLSLFLDEIV